MTQGTSRHPSAALISSQPGPPRAHCALCVYSKQWKTNTNKKPTSPYTAPAILGHLVYLASQIPGRSALSCQSRAPGGGGGRNSNPHMHPKGSELPRRTAPAAPQQAVPSHRAQQHASEKAGGSKWTAPGDSPADADVLGDLRLPAPRLAPHSACPQLPDTHSLLKTKVSKKKKKRDCQLQEFWDDSDSCLDRVLHILGELECSEVFPSKSRHTPECPPSPSFKQPFSEVPTPDLSGRPGVERRRGRRETGGIGSGGHRPPSASPERPFPEGEP